jgi:hypothetical protein
LTFSKIEHFKDQVIGLRPVYTNTGNATEIFLDSGNIIVDGRGLKSVIKAFARSFAIDLKAQRVMLGDWIQRRSLMPFFVGKNRVFIPLKMRQTITANDASNGYLDVNYISEIKEAEKKRCLLLLTNGITCEVFSNRNTIIQNQHLGLSLLEMLEDPGKESEEENLIVNSARIIARTLGKMSKQLDNIEGKIT